MKSMSPMRGGRIPTSETPAPSSHHKQRSARIPKENVDPGPFSSENPPFRSPSFTGKPLASKNQSPLPPRPPASNPSGNPLKRKLNLEAVHENGAPSSSVADSGVQVILRMRPPNEEEEEGGLVVQKISRDAVSILDHTFTFDSVADTGSTQQDIFQLVGVPLVENCLAGFNSSIFAYGQTGSGKTYTMWGPPTALSKDDLSSSQRGLTPRVFEQLFTRIKEEQIKHSDKQLSYQCRCSFLEIYNEQITDLLDPSHGNLQIREDVRTGVYVENLTEGYVCSMKDVTQLLIKGLENRRTGATSLNAESSRSHCVFTCIVESRSKCILDGLNRVRTSRINLVDLAGSERQKQTGAAGERLKEAGNINRSLSQLGNLINILAEMSQSGKQRHIPYRDSKLTFLLQESLGGNAKLAMICAISPLQSCKSETLSTLRFAQRAKAIKNKAVVNEDTEDDVNVLREQIRQLKDELLRMKSNGGSTGNNGSYSTGWNARRSLTILRQSLSRPMRVQLEDDNDEEMEIDEEDIEKPSVQVDIAHEGVIKDVDMIASKFDGSEEAPIVDVSNISMEVCESEKVVQDQLGLNNSVTKFDHADDSDGKTVEQENSRSFLASTGENPSLGPDLSHISLISSLNSNMQPCLSIVPCETTPVVELQTSSLSPKVENSKRKSLRTSLASASSEGSHRVSRAGSGSLMFPSRQTLTQTSSKSFAQTEHLVASLHRGLEFFDNQKMLPMRSSFRFPFKTVDYKPPITVAKVDFGMQTVPQESEMPEDSSLYICNYCKNKVLPIDCKDAGVETELQLVPVDGPNYSEKSMKQVPKAVEKVLAGAIRREMAIEEHCAKQAAEIAHLNRLVQQYKHERECNAIIEQTREGKICRLEGLMDGIVPAEHYMEEEFMSLANEHKILKEKYENHPEVLRLNIELRRVRDEFDRYRNFFDLGERDVLVEEIQDLRCQLQYYIDSSPMTSRKWNSLLKLAYRNDVACLQGVSESVKEKCVDNNFEEERRQWTETESKWISLTEELRLELEEASSLAEKQKMELDSEKKCLEELKQALQTAMQGHACILDQYADLQEKHVQLLARHRKIRDGITDVKRAAARAGVKGTESKFIDALAAEISALKAEREKERRYWRDENKGLQAQLRDTAEALQAAGELLVRLKEAEETAALAQKQSLKAEKEAEKAHQDIDSLKKKHETEIATLNQFLAESRLPKEALRPAYCDVEPVNYDTGGSLTDQRWREEFEPFHQGVVDSDFSRGAEHRSWFSDYDRCNI